MKPLRYTLAASLALLLGSALVYEAQEAESLDDRVDRAVEGLRSESETVREAAQDKLKGLGKDAVPRLQKQADDAKKNGEPDVERRLRDAIKTLDPNATPEPAQKAGPRESDETDKPKTSGGGTGFRFSGGNGVYSRSESNSGTSREIEENNGGKVTKMSREGSGHIKGSVTDANGKQVETFEFATPEDMKKERPDLAKVWEGENAGFSFKVIPAQPQPLDPEVEKARAEHARVVKRLEALNNLLPEDKDENNQKKIADLTDRKNELETKLREKGVDPNRRQPERRVGDVQERLRRAAEEARSRQEELDRELEKQMREMEEMHRRFFGGEDKAQPAPAPEPQKEDDGGEEDF